MRPELFALLALALRVQRPVFMAPLLPPVREEALEIAKRTDFALEIRTQPRQVWLVILERFFDHFRRGAALWRGCNSLLGCSVCSDLNAGDFQKVLKRGGDAVALCEFEPIPQGG